MNKLELVKKYNIAYREGNTLISDEEYDELYDSLTPEEKEKIGVGSEPTSRKQKLPCPMYSMDKLKQFDEIKKWITSKNIPSNAEFIITPKYDGLSFVKHSNSADCWTRGDGSFGQYSKEHHNMLDSNKMHTYMGIMENYILGEVIMPKKSFKEKYSKDFKNARNLVAGLFNNKTPTEPLKDVHFVCYGLAIENTDKLHQLEQAISQSYVEVPYLLTKFETITEEILTRLYKEWSEDYELDGLIIEVNDYKLREKLGRERNNNPAYARAIKIFAENSSVTTIKAHTLNVAKDGRISFVGQVEPIELDGVTISNVTLNNAQMIEKNGWGIGAEVEIIRSGAVIPKIIKTITPVEVDLPVECPCCSSDLSWDSNFVQLKCPNKECPERVISEMESFMVILGIENVGEGVVTQLYRSGYTSIKSVLEATIRDFLTVEGFGEKKAKLIYDSIHSKLKDVELSKVQHAVNLFSGLGSKKLKLLEAYDTPDNIPTHDVVIGIDGFSEISAITYLNGIVEFWKQIKELPITITKAQVIEASGDKCKDMIFVFTGVRAKDLEEEIVNQGGTIGSGVSKKTTHLVCKDKESGSSKVKKAEDLGCIIMELDDLKDMLK